MKTRSGFVSNSSSSSFIYIIGKSDYDDLFAKLDEYQQAVLKELGVCEKEVLGQEAVIISGMTGNTSSFEYMEAIEVDQNLTDEEFEEKYGYERYPEVAFEAIPWPKGTFHDSVNC